jgi:hypothetical protein
MDAEGLQKEVPFSWRYGTLEVQRQADGKVSVGEFTPFAVRDPKDNRWSHTGKIPDPKWSYAFLNPQSGHAGNGSIAPAARWTSPKEMTVRLVGHVKKPSEKGNGVRAFVVSSRTGPIKEVLVAPTKSEPVVVEAIKVQAGETLTFAVGSEGDTNSDSFEWKMVIHEGDHVVTDARKDFCGVDGWPLNRTKPQTPLAQLAQVLMMSNEFQFVD